MISHRLHAGRWILVDFGVYRMASTPSTWSLALMAACLAGPAVASHLAAAYLWRYPGFLQPAPEVTAYRHRRRSQPEVVWHESWFLDERRDVTKLDGIPVTSATRTIIDLSTVATVASIEIALDNACHRGLTSVDRVGEELDRLGRRFGTTRIRQVLELKARDGAPSAESPLETRMAIVLRESDLPRPIPQFEIYGVNGLIGRVDFAWPDHHVVLEVDGFGHHSYRDAWERDLGRRGRLAAAGWRVHHATHESLKDPAAIVAQLRTSLCVS